MEVQECATCYGEGKLAGYFNKVPHYNCPWCRGSGQVEENINAAFRRVSKVLPKASQACCVFGNGEAPVKLPKLIA